jgi:Tfp pilus assembly protein PilN
MIELNLLPKELRRKKTTALPEIPLLPIAVVFVAVLVVVHVLIGGAFARVKGNEGVLRARWQELKPQKSKVEEINKSTKEIEAKLDATKFIITPPVDWSELLTGLNKANVQGVWLTAFQPVFRNTPERSARGARPGAGQQTAYGSVLELTGFALGRSEIATSTVAKFIDSLKDTEEFFEYFEEIELNDIRNQVLEGEEVMNFKIICRFKRPQGQ